MHEEWCRHRAIKSNFVQGFQSSRHGGVNSVDAQKKSASVNPSRQRLAQLRRKRSRVEQKDARNEVRPSDIATQLQAQPRL